MKAKKQVDPVAGACGAHGFAGGGGEAVVDDEGAVAAADDEAAGGDFVGDGSVDVVEPDGAVVAGDEGCDEDCGPVSEDEADSGRENLAVGGLIRQHYDIELALQIRTK